MPLYRPLAGNWEISTAEVMGTCGAVPRILEATITQDGNALTAEIPGATLSGTINGNQMQLNGIFPEDGGTVTLSVKVTVSADGDSMQGSDNWTVTYGSDECWGSESVSAIRISEHSEVCESLCAKVSKCLISNCGQWCYLNLAEGARMSAECEDAVADVYACVAGLPSCEQVNAWWSEIPADSYPCKPANDLARLPTKSLVPSIDHVTLVPSLSSAKSNARVASPAMGSMATSCKPR